jgi:hypothetical protein
VKRPKHFVILPHPDVEDDERGTHWKDLSQESRDDWRFTEALESADDYGAFGPLVNCLRSGMPMSLERCEMLAELLSGRRLSRRYPFSDRQQRLLEARFLYKLYRKKGKPTAQCLKMAARECDVSEQALQELIDQKGHLANRLRQRRKR